MKTRHMEESQRGHGFTTLQMQHAARDALYIWPVHGSLQYARDLARKHGREDLEIVSGSILDNDAEKLRGRRLTGIILDHAAEPTDKEYELLYRLRSQIIRKRTA